MLGLPSPLKLLAPFWSKRLLKHYETQGPQNENVVSLAREYVLATRRGDTTGPAADPGETEDHLRMLFAKIDSPSISAEEKAACRLASGFLILQLRNQHSFGQKLIEERYRALLKL